MKTITSLLKIITFCWLFAVAQIQAKPTFHPPPITTLSASDCQGDPLKMEVNQSYEDRLSQDYADTSDRKNIERKFLKLFWDHHNEMLSLYSSYRGSLNLKNLTEKQRLKLCVLGTYYGDFSNLLAIYFAILRGQNVQNRWNYTVTNKTEVEDKILNTYSRFRNTYYTYKDQ